MPLTSGTKLGPYEISSELGAGGMGEVYRARDTRLGRVVALKVLRSDLSANGDLRGRFEREARAVASLNHPHICALHDVGRADGVDFLVLEHLEGETLADRIGKGPLPVAEALDLAIEIAGALASAHRCGVIHRDLKPGNVMLTRFGAKLLDFGLARLRPGSSGAVASELGAQSSERPLTAEAAVVGTFPYMAPEQIQGKDVDARADVFSAGVVLYEMLTGRRPFQADNPAGLMAAILHTEPPRMTANGPEVPHSLERLVRHCLAKAPDERWQSAHDLELELQWIRESALRPQAASRSSARRARLGWIAASAAGLAALALGTLLLRSRQAPPPREVIRFSLEIPEGTNFEDPYWSHPRVSPDGRTVAFTAYTAAARGLWIRPLDALSARLLPGTEEALAPFWSPDSRAIAFFAEGKLKSVPIAGGSPRSLCDVPSLVACGAWSSTGAIVFGISEAPGRDGLYQVPSSGGEPVLMRFRDAGGEEIAEPFFPSFLPDGRFLFLGGWEGLYVAWPGSDEAVRLASGRIQSRVEYASPGYLLGVAENTLIAYRLDKLSLEGDPFVVAENVGTFAAASHFSVSDTGVLVYRPLNIANSRLAWFDRAGLMLETAGDVGLYEDICLSPDGQRAAVAMVDPRTSASDLWVLRFSHESPLRLTSVENQDEFGPVWSPDGAEIAYSWSRDGTPHLFRMGIDDREPELLVAHNGHVQWVCDWSPDGRTILFVDRDPITGLDLWMLELGGDAPGSERKPVPWLQTRFQDGGARFSPDGRWVAYTSDDTGRLEVYVQPFRGPGERRRVSTDGGRMPRWRGDGQEILYVDLNADPAIVSVPLDPATLEPAEPQTLFRVGTRLRNFDVTEDGQRFLINHEIGAASRTLVHVVMNWTESSRADDSGD